MSALWCGYEIEIRTWFEVFVGGMDCEVMPCSTQVWEVWACSLPTCDNGGWGYSQVMSLKFVYAPTLVHEVMQPDMCIKEVMIVLQVL